MYLKRMLYIVANELSFEIGRTSVMRVCETKRVQLDLYGSPCTKYNTVVFLDCSKLDLKQIRVNNNLDNFVSVRS